MRSRRSAQDQVAEVARKRLELLSAELAEIRLTPVEPPPPGVRDGSGELEPASLVGASAEPGSPSLVPGRHAHRSVGWAGSIGGWVEDRLPPSLQGRVQMSAAHLVVVGAVVAVGLSLTLWWVTRADGAGSALPAVAGPASALVTVSPSVAPPPSASGSSSGSPSVSSSASPTGAGAAGGASGGSSVGTVVVDVTGKVRRPGIATLPSGSRVIDAVKAAGGARRGVALGSINLARVLADGEQIVVGQRVAPSGVAASAAAGGAPSVASPIPMVNINTGTEAELEELPGVGPVTAQSILDYREENGPFSSVDGLLEVSGIGDATLAKIALYATI